MVMLRPSEDTIGLITQTMGKGILWLLTVAWHLVANVKNCAHNGSHYNILQQHEY